MKILLAAINAKYIHSNLAVYCLKAYADLHCHTEQENNELQIEIGEYTINQQMDDIMRDVYERQPDVLCLSCYIWNLKYVEELIREIKKSVRILRFGPAARKFLMTHRMYFEDCRKLPV